jgi:hypothetical protein
MRKKSLALGLLKSVYELSSISAWLISLQPVNNSSLKKTHQSTIVLSKNTLAALF